MVGQDVLVAWFVSTRDGARPHTPPLRLRTVFFACLTGLTWNCGPLTSSQVLEFKICATMPDLAPVVLHCQDLVVIKLAISLYT